MFNIPQPQLAPSLSLGTVAVGTDMKKEVASDGSTTSRSIPTVSSSLSLGTVGTDMKKKPLLTVQV